MVYSTKRFVLALSCVNLFLYFFSPFCIALSLLGKKELILVLFVRLFGLRLLGFVCFLFLFVSGMGCGLWMWHFLDIFLIFLFSYKSSIVCFTRLSVQITSIGFQGNNADLKTIWTIWMLKWDGRAAAYECSTPCTFLLLLFTKTALSITQA